LRFYAASDLSIDLQQNPFDRQTFNLFFSRS